MDSATHGPYYRPYTRHDRGEGGPVTEMTGDSTSGRDPRDGEAGRAPDGRADRGAVRAGTPRVALSAGARTPEELETLLEDALVLRDGEVLAGLFETGAVLLAGEERPARGGREIAQAVLAAWTGDHTYVADPRQVLQARDLVLILARGVNVARRGSDGAWRYAIVLRSVDDGTERREP